MKNNFSENLAKLRQLNKLSRKELAEKLGVSEQSIHYYETGKRETNFSTLIKISDLFGVSIDKLFRGDVGDDVEEIEKNRQKQQALSDAILNLPPERLPLLAELVKVTSEIGGQTRENGSVDYNVTITVAPKNAQDTNEPKEE